MTGPDTGAGERVEWIAERPVRYRSLCLADGLRVQVAEYIERNATQDGWVLRYGEWSDYPDPTPNHAGAQAALARADEELRFRLNTLGK